MTLTIVLLGSKGSDVQVLPPFIGIFDMGGMRITVDGQKEPDKLQIVLENVPLNEGFLNFLKKYGQVNKEYNELVVDADKLTFTDYLPFALQIVMEACLGTTRPQDSETTGTVPNVNMVVLENTEESKENPTTENVTTEEEFLANKQVD